MVSAFDFSNQGKTQLSFFNNGVWKVYGQANQAANIPNTVETKFNVASISKMFTSVGIAKLVEEGRLKYDDFVAKLMISDHTLIGSM